MKKLMQKMTKAKRYHSHILALSLILLLIFTVYSRDLDILTNEALQSEALTHTFLIPFFMGFLLYQKKDLFKASLFLQKLKKPAKSKYLDEIAGITFCLIAFLLYWYGSYTFYPLQYHLLSLPIFIIGIILILFTFNALKTIIFPLLLLLFIIPLPNETMYSIGGILANINTQASYILLKIFGIPVTLSASYGAPMLILTTSTSQSTSFTIDLPCSGIYTLITFIMFAIFLTLIVSTQIYKKLITFLIGFTVFEILNILRLTIIISAAYHFGEEIAMLIFHTSAGLILTFIGMLLALFASEKILKIKFISKTERTLPCPHCKTSLNNPEGFCLHCGKFFRTSKWRPSQTFWAKLVLLLLGCSLVTLSINAPVFAIAQEEIKVTSNWENTTNILPQLPQYNLRFLYRDTDYERIAKQDASLVYAYFPNSTSNPVIYALIGVANSISNLHSWEVCLISWQTAQGRYPIVTVLDSSDIELLKDVPLIARYLVFQNLQNYTQITLYWYEKATFRTRLTVQQKYVRISLVILTRNSTNPQNYKNKLLNFGQTIASYWEPIKTQSLISLGVLAQQTLLILSTAFIIITKTIQYTNEWWKKTSNLKIFNNFASPEEKMLKETIIELSKKKKAISAQEINLAIKRKIGKIMKIENLIERLKNLQEYGFIKMDIISDNNKPLLAWKSLVNI